MDFERVYNSSHLVESDIESNDLNDKNDVLADPNTTKSNKIGTPETSNSAD